MIKTEDFIPFFFLGLFFIFVALIAGSFFWSRSLSQEYPLIVKEEAVFDTIQSIISDGRASARVTFRSHLKRSLPWAKIFDSDGVEYNLPKTVEEGDVVMKNSNSDTIIVVKANQRFVFISEKLIPFK